MKLVALLTSLCLAATLHAQTSPNQASATQTSASQGNASLLVLSKHDHTLAIVDPGTLKVTARVPVGNDPHEVIASTDGSTAYVSNYGGGAYNTLAVIDLLNQRALVPSTSARCVAHTDSPSSAGRPGSPPRPQRPSAATIPPRRRWTGSSAPVRTAPT
jgi:YVTN family beta-propeller protein